MFLDNQAASLRNMQRSCTKKRMQIEGFNHSFPDFPLGTFLFRLCARAVSVTLQVHYYTPGPSSPARPTPTIMAKCSSDDNVCRWRSVFPTQHGALPQNDSSSSTQSVWMWTAHQVNRRLRLDYSDGDLQQWTDAADTGQHLIGGQREWAAGRGRGLEEGLKADW